MNIRPDIERKISLLIDILKDEKAFENKIIPDPPQEHSKIKFVEWTKNIKEILENGVGITDSIKALLPTVVSIFNLLNQ